MVNNRLWTLLHAAEPDSRLLEFQSAVWTLVRQKSYSLDVNRASVTEGLLRVAAHNPQADLHLGDPIYLGEDLAISDPVDIRYDLSLDLVDRLPTQETYTITLPDREERTEFATGPRELDYDLRLGSDIPLNHPEAYLGAETIPIPYFYGFYVYGDNIVQLPRLPGGETLVSLYVGKGILQETLYVSRWGQLPAADQGPEMDAVTLEDLAYGILNTLNLPQPELLVSTLRAVALLALENQVIVADLDSYAPGPGSGGFASRYRRSTLKQTTSEYYCSENAIFALAVSAGLRRLQELAPAQLVELNSELIQQLQAVLQSIGRLFTWALDINSGFIYNQVNQTGLLSNSSSSTASALVGAAFQSILSLAYQEDLHLAYVHLYQALHRLPTLPTEPAYQMFPDLDLHAQAASRYLWCVAENRQFELQTLERFLDYQDILDSHSLVWYSLARAAQERPPLVSIINAELSQSLTYQQHQLLTQLRDQELPIPSFYAGFDSLALEIGLFTAYLEQISQNLQPAGVLWAGEAQRFNRNSALGSLLFSNASTAVNSILAIFQRLQSSGLRDLQSPDLAVWLWALYPHQIIAGAKFWRQWLGQFVRRQRTTLEAFTEAYQHLGLQQLPTHQPLKIWDDPREFDYIDYASTLRVIERRVFNPLEPNADDLFYLTHQPDFIPLQQPPYRQESDAYSRTTWRPRRQAGLVDVFNLSTTQTLATDDLRLSDVDCVTPFENAQIWIAARRRTTTGIYNLLTQTAAAGTRIHLHWHDPIKVATQLNAGTVASTLTPESTVIQN